MTNGQNPAPTQPASSQPPQAQVFEKKKNNTWKWIVFGGCGCFFVLVLAIVLIFAAVIGIKKAIEKPVLPVFTAQVEAIKSGDMDKAYSYCSDEFRQITDREAFEVFINKGKKVLTAPKNSFNNAKRENNVIVLKGNFVITNENGQVETYPVTYQFINKNGQWLVNGINIGE